MALLRAVVPSPSIVAVTSETRSLSIEPALTTSWAEMIGTSWFSTTYTVSPLASWKSAISGKLTALGVDAAGGAG